MRSLELLITEYPDKTGKEILQIQMNDVKKDQKEKNKRNKKKLDFINDINSNGGFYKGAFGTDQYYLYNITHASLESGRVMAKLDKIVLFYAKDLKTSVLGKDTLRFEITTKEYENLENYGLDYEHISRITKEEYFKVYDALNSIVPTFFKKELDLRQKEFGKQ